MIDCVLWRARVGISNAFKFQAQVKSNMKNPLLFQKIFLLFINYIYTRIIYLISFSTFRFLKNILQLVVVEILFYYILKSCYIYLSKKGGVCVYYKEHIPLLRRYDLCTLSNCLVTKFVWKSKSASLPVITDHQTQHELENFCTSLDTLMDHINNELTILLVITGDLNAGCSK